MSVQAREKASPRTSTTKSSVSPVITAAARMENSHGGVYYLASKILS